MNKLERKRLEEFLEYLHDKVEECYKKETEQAIKEFKEKIN